MFVAYHFLVVGNLMVLEHTLAVELLVTILAGEGRLRMCQHVLL